MRPEDWQRVKEIFALAFDEPKENRLKFLRQTCGDDRELLAEVQSLLEAGDETEQFIERNGFDLAARLTAEAKNYDFTKFGHYRVLREIGRGGMGAVFLAERSDGEFDQRVALKIIRQNYANAEIERHFRRERQILASLNHPNIARLLDGGVSDAGELYLVMEYIEGAPLLEYADEHALSVEERLRLFLKICRAVSFAHQNLIVHRDIKPANILVAQNGEPKLLDFGLAKITAPTETKALEDAAAAEQTNTFFRAFTPGYASPEQILGKNVTTASDVYSLGVVLYELLTGEKPFHYEGKSLEEIIKTVAESEAPPPSSVWNSKFKIQDAKFEPDNPKSKIRNLKFIRGDLDNITLKALNKESARRYKSVEALADDIERHLSGLPVRARPNTVSYRAAKFFRRNKIVVSATAFVILALISGLTIALWQANAARFERDRAEKRFAEVRQLSNALLNDIAPKIERLEGSTEARQAVVVQSLKYLDSLAFESADDLTLQAELAAAYEKVGALQGDSRKPSLSDFRGAIASLEKAQKIRRRRLAENPRDAENRRLLAENLRLLAIRRMYQNDIEGGFRDSSEALRIYRELIGENPDALDLRRSFLELRIEDATGYSDIGRFSEAIPLLEQSASDIENLRQSNPNDPEIERIQAKCLAFLAFALSWESHQKEAETKMTRAAEIAEQLAARFPGDTNFRQDLYKIYLLSANIYEEIDDRRAFDLCEKARIIAEEIVAVDRANAQARHNLVRIYARLGAAAASLGKPVVGLDYLEKSARLLSELKERDRLNRGYDHESSTLYKRIGDVKYQQSDLRGSLEAYETGLQFSKKELENDAANTLALRSLAIAYRNMGLVHRDFAQIAGGESRRNHRQAAKENFRLAFKFLSEAEAKNSLPAADRAILEEVKAAVENLEKIEDSGL